MLSKTRKAAATLVAAVAALLAFDGSASAAPEPEPVYHGLHCPAMVPSQPTGADYVNAWNLSGACFGAGLAGLASAAWAGTIPSIVQGAFSPLG